RDAKERGTIAQLRENMERSFDLFPNPKSRGGAAVTPAFRARARTLRLENRLVAAAALRPRWGSAPSAWPADAAAQVLKRAAETTGTQKPLAPAPAPTGRAASSRHPAPGVRATGPLAASPLKAGPPTGRPALATGSGLRAPPA